MTYYNENDPWKAKVLAALCADALISPGLVDNRSIRDVRPDDVRLYGRAHFFSGAGLWDLALTRAGWPSDVRAWTGSCPCQPFSAAGKRKGKADDRHLWPEFYRLIAKCRPPVVIGEQVGGKGGRAWFDDVQNDLEADGYTVGAIDTPACGVGAPHIRQRLYWAAWLADSQSLGWRRGRASQADGRTSEPERLRDAGGVGLPNGISGELFPGAVPGAQKEIYRARIPDGDVSNGPSCAGPPIGVELPSGDRRDQRRAESSEWSAISGCGAVRGYWAGADWVLTRPKRVGGAPSLRPIEPGSFPLAHGSAQRSRRLRLWGDAIVLPQAQAWVEVVMEEIGLRGG